MDGSGENPSSPTASGSVLRCGPDNCSGRTQSPGWPAWVSSVLVRGSKSQRRCPMKHPSCGGEDTSHAASFSHIRFIHEFVWLSSTFELVPIDSMPEIWHSSKLLLGVGAPDACELTFLDQHFFLSLIHGMVVPKIHLLVPVDAYFVFCWATNFPSRPLFLGNHRLDILCKKCNPNLFCMGL